MTARQKRKGKGSKPSRTSISKLSNKRLNKLAKQGKLKKSLGKKKLVNLLNRRTNKPGVDENETVENDIPLEEADYEYFATPGRNFSFLSQLSERDNRKRKRNDDDYDCVEGKYDKKPRKISENKTEMKALLPFKSKEKGIIPRVVEVERKYDDKEEDEAIEEEKINEEVEVLAATPMEEVIQQELQRKESKKLIKELSNSVMESVEENVQKLKELRSFLGTDDEKIALSVRKLASISLMNVYKDVIPGYKIRVLTSAEKKQSMKKETKKLNVFEDALLANYRQYLESLETMATGKRPSDKRKKDKENKNKKMKRTQTVHSFKVNESLRTISVKCLCELLVTHPHFNFRTEIIAVVLRFITSANTELSDMVCDSVKRIFSEDKCGDVSLEVVRLIGRVIKAKNFEVNSKILDTFLSLKIKEIDKTGESKKSRKMKREERMKKFSKRERKREKELEFLEKELRDAAAETDVKRKLRLHTEIINMIFLTYFRILKLGRRSSLLASVLAGLAKFAHLINVSFFDDMFAIMAELVANTELTTRESLHCIETSSVLLMGQGEALNIDPFRFYNHLYTMLLQLHAGNQNDDTEIALRCVDALINKRHRQVSQQRILAFIKRLCTVALQMTSKEAVATLAALRNIMQRFPNSDVMLEVDNFGSGIYMPELDNPEHCNACNTALYELHLLRRSYHPQVKISAEIILHGHAIPKDNRHQIKLPRHVSGRL